MDQPIDRFRSSTLGWLRGTLAGWGTVLLAVLGIVGMVLAGGAVLPVPAAAPLVLTIAAFAILAWKWVENLATTYEICPDRLLLRRGIFIKSIADIELYRVKDVRLDFTLWGQWANIGTIGLISSDATTRDDALVMPDIENAQSRRETLRGLVEAARQKRRVRELDVSGDEFA